MKPTATGVLLVAVICYWIVGIWVPDPVMGELHANYKVKIFWTVISVFVLFIVVESYTRHWRRK